MAPTRSLTAMTLLTLTLAGCGGGSAEQSAEPTSVATPGVNASSSPEDPSAVPSGSAGATVAPSASGSGPATSTGKKPTTAKHPTKPVAGPARYAFPVSAGNVSWHPTHGKYPATDIFADCGKPVVAATDGVVLEVSRKDTYVQGEPDGPANGGLSVSILGDDGVRYYGSHLSKIQAGIAGGVRVAAGKQLGLVGRTGNANNVCHLHFGISPECAGTGDWKVRRGVVWPYSYLDSWRKNGNKSPVAGVAAWENAKNCTA